MVPEEESPSPIERKIELPVLGNWDAKVLPLELVDQLESRPSMLVGHEPMAESRPSIEPMTARGLIEEEKAADTDWADLDIPLPVRSVTCAMHRQDSKLCYR